MTRPNELKLDLPVDIANNVVSTTGKVWDILEASYLGNLEKIKQLIGECPELAFAQYNYMPPIHFAVREGHYDLVKYLLSLGACDPGYKTYPFQDNLVTVAEDREYRDIGMLLSDYAQDFERQKFRGDNGGIHFKRTEIEKEFESAVDRGDVEKVAQMLTSQPDLALDETFFWSEGILMMPVKDGNFSMVDLLMRYGAKVPDILKWTKAYYFETYSHAAYIMQKGMNPNTRSWQEVTILHDIAQKGDVQKASLLLQYGANINPVEEEYQSTPLAMAARWGHTEMVTFLLEKGADPHKSGATWSTPLSWAVSKGHTDIEKILRATVELH